MKNVIYCRLQVVGKKRGNLDITQITPKEGRVLSQIRGSVVVLRDQINKELRKTIDPNHLMIKLGKQSN